MWGTINEALNSGKKKTDFPSSFTMNGRELTDSLEIANEFSIFFANVGINSSVADATGVDSQCEDFTYSDYLNNPTVHRFKIDLMSGNDIIAIIKQMEGKCSSGIDELSNKPLKSITFEITKPLAIIITQSLETGIFPEMLKIAKLNHYTRKVTRLAPIIIDQYHCCQLSPRCLSELYTLNFVDILNCKLSLWQS